MAWRLCDGWCQLWDRSSPPSLFSAKTLRRALGLGLVCELTLPQPASWHTPDGRTGSSTTRPIRRRGRSRSPAGRCSSMRRRFRRSFASRHCAVNHVRSATISDVRPFLICCIIPIAPPDTAAVSWSGCGGWRTWAVLVAPLFAAPNARVALRLDRANMISGACLST